MKRLLILLAASITLVACGGGGGGDDSSLRSSGDGGSGATYVNWVNNANGQYILDATDEAFRVDANTRMITYTDPGSGVTTSYTNTHVGASAVFSLNNNPLGHVTEVLSTSNQTIAAFVCFNDQTLDIFGPASGPTFNCNTGVMPVFALAGAAAVEATAPPSGKPTVLQPAAGTSLPPNLDSTGWEGGEAVAN